MQQLYGLLITCVLFAIISSAAAAPGDCTSGMMSGSDVVTAVCQTCMDDGCDATINPDVDCSDSNPDGQTGSVNHPGIDFAQGSCLPWNDAMACTTTDYALITECFAPDNTCSDTWYLSLSERCMSCGHGNGLRASTAPTAENYESIYGLCHTPLTEDDETSGVAPATSGVALATPMMLATLVALVAMVSTKI